MAPLAYHGAVLDEHQTWVAAYDGLQRGLVTHAEGVLGSGDVAPVLYGVLAARREAIERHLLRLTVLVELVYVAEIGIIGTLEMGRDEQEGISLVVEYLLGDVVTGSIIGNGKVVDGRHVAFFHEFTLALYECPCGVGIVVER